MTPDLSRMLPLRKLRQFIHYELRKAQAQPEVDVETLVAAVLTKARAKGYAVSAGEVRDESLAIISRQRYRREVPA